MKKKKPIYKRIWFWILIVIVAMAAIGSLGGSGSPDEGSEEPAPAETNEIQDEETSKEDAKAKDLEIYSTVLSAETKFKGLVDTLDTGSMLDVYDACKDTKDFAQDCWGRVSDQKDDLNGDYVNSCQDYFVQIKIICEYIMDYIDDQKMEDMSKAKDGIESLNIYVMNVVSQRLTYLSDAGFTEDEIAEITEQ